MRVHHHLTGGTHPWLCCNRMEEMNYRNLDRHKVPDTWDIGCCVYMLPGLAPDGRQ